MTLTATALSPGERTLGGGLVAIAIAIQSMTMGRAIIALDVGLIVALVLWVGTAWRPRAKGILPIYLLGLLTFVVHFGEELTTGFYRSFPELMGYEWPASRFIAFNAIWGALFLLAAAGIKRGSNLAYLIILFFAVGGGLMNGIGHVLLALMRGSYFPGLITAPLMLIVGLALAWKLYRSPDAGARQP